MNYILIHWSYGRKSMEAVVSKMTEPCEIFAKKNNGTWWRYTESTNIPDKNGRMWEQVSLSYISSEIDNEDNRVINWGNSIFGASREFDLNNPRAVSLGSNKRESRRVLQNKGVAVPHTWFYGEDFTNEGLNEGAIIARPSHHHAGKDFYVIASMNDYVNLSKKHDLGSWYFSEIFQKTHEYRVHCAHGKVLMISDKPISSTDLRANHAVVEEAWRALKWSEFNPKVCEESLKAMEVLGLDYGAVDIMYNANDDSVAICEVNTSPSITTDYTSGKYAAYFDWVIRHDFPEHFKIDGKSVFYNEILRD